jgi:hypothetical protein
MTANEGIRSAIKDAGLRHWQIAAALNLSESAFCRLLRRELSEEKRIHILAIIANLNKK